MRELTVEELANLLRKIEEGHRISGHPTETWADWYAKDFFDRGYIAAEPLL